MEVRNARCRHVYDLGVADDPHVFALASGVLTHNSKPNPMPESVTDRCTKAHEYVFLLTKSARYYYDHEAIKEPSSVSNEWREPHPKYLSETHGNGETSLRKGFNRVGKIGGTRNRRSVWTIATRPYSGAHYAVFPPDLIRPMIQAGTSERGCCPQCGAPWERVVERERTFESGSGKAGNLPLGKNGPGLQGGGETVDIRRGPVVHATTIGWRPTCDCDAGEPVPCTVLDPFAGSGTTALVALEQRRRAVLIELSAQYAEEHIMPRIQEAQMQPVLL